jgi:anti-anti-sigma regulatory factor
MERFRINTPANSDTCTLMIGGDVDLERASEIIELGTASLDATSSQSLTIDLSRS